MRAMVIERFGAPEVLELQHVPRPVFGPDELLVAVHAAGVNPVDGQNRSDGTWANLAVPAVLGSDFSGVIEAAGSEAGPWEVGDPVFGVLPFQDNRHGTYAEYCVAKASQVARKPETLSHAEAAAAPLAATTAHEVLRRLGLKPNDWLLINGAGGGVGTFAVQLARIDGIQVVAAASSRHHDLLLELGASHCFDYRTEDVVRKVLGLTGDGVDGVADLVGGTTLSLSLPGLRERGAAAAIAGLPSDMELLIDRNQTLHGVLLDPTRDGSMRVVAESLGEGRLRSVVSDVLPLDAAAEAHRRLEAGHVQGKLVLEVRHE